MDETATLDSTFTAHLHYSEEYDPTGFSNPDGHYSFTFSTGILTRILHKQGRVVGVSRSTDRTHTHAVLPQPRVNT